MNLIIIIIIIIIVYFCFCLQTFMGCSNSSSYYNVTEKVSPWTWRSFSLEVGHLLKYCMMCKRQ